MSYKYNYKCDVCAQAMPDNEYKITRVWTGSYYSDGERMTIKIRTHQECLPKCSRCTRQLGGFDITCRYNEDGSIICHGCIYGLPVETIPQTLAEYEGAKGRQYNALLNDAIRRRDG
jgi:hypothetical protein